MITSQFGFSQIKELYPNSVEIINLSLEGEREFLKNKDEYILISDKLSKGMNYDDLTEKEKSIFSNYSETIEGYWEIIGSGCSWYCGGGTKKVTASSFLKAQGENNYKPQNAHDLNFKNAWVEGTKGYGIGEYLLYTFSGSSPRINEIIVVNGYVKSKTAWENNSRVKKLKVYLNNKPYAILNLKDSRSSQSFKVEPIGNGNRDNLKMLETQPDWTLKFEILEVYKGLKYDDVVISEIYFDGLDVH